ncbi:hypothetical protein [Brevibacterium sediminis]|uniref:Uncharacterized protein n=1 Tax=Brevibacterium sediminis TaxID=1857024 RepID=A0A5C4WX11_9MICO|nr:hypothetical protein [Brevibacterium sediminis]TNM52878.1 hypothetical protein FHQ09_17335 [Brevibacterium sediminis]
MLLTDEAAAPTTPMTALTIEISSTGVVECIFGHASAISHAVSMTEGWDTASWRYWRMIRNDAGARGPYRDSAPIPVRVRVEWAEDSEDRVAGIAMRQGFDGAIFIELRDRRCQAMGVRLRPEDVQPTHRL